MELRDSLPTLSSSFLPDPSDDHLPTRNYGNDQALSYTDDNLLSNAAQVLGAMKGRKDSHISSGGTADIVEKVPRCDEIVTYTSSLDNSCFTTQAAVTPESIAHCNSLSSTLSTFPEERLQSSASRPSPRSEGTWSEEVEEAFQKGLPLNTGPQLQLLIYRSLATLSTTRPQKDSIEWQVYFKEPVDLSLHQKEDRCLQDPEASL